MRIEVIIGNDEPLIFPLSKPKVLIGSMDTCDIVLRSNSVSRKHLVVISSGDKFFVVDQGSTNGSFINEERLVPGQNKDFNSFFPVRLGADVLITLLPDEEAANLGLDSSLNDFAKVSPKPSEAIEEEKTKVISLSKLEKSSTAELVNKRNENLDKRKVVHKAKQEKTSAAKPLVNSNKKLGLFLVLVMTGVAYYQFKVKPLEENKSSNPEVVKPIEVVENKKPIQRIDVTLLPDPQKLLPLVKGPKCSTELEKYFCSSMPNIFELWFGTVMQEKNVIIVANGTKYFQRAHKYLGDIKKGHANYPSDLNLAAVMLWVSENIPQDLKSFEKGQDNFFTLFMISENQEEPAYLGGATFVPESILKLKQNLLEKHFKAAEKNGAVEFSFALDYMRLM